MRNGALESTMRFVLFQGSVIDWDGCGRCGVVLSVRMGKEAIEQSIWEAPGVKRMIVRHLMDIVS